MVYIFLGTKSGNYSSPMTRHINGTTQVIKEIQEEIKNFEVIKYKIEYPGNYGVRYESSYWKSYYDIYIYPGPKNNKGKYEFLYYWPTYYYIVSEVSVYYSQLKPNDPLIISFTTKYGNTYKCVYSRLKLIGWDYGQKISKYVFIEDLDKRLILELYSLLKGKKITVRAGGDDDKGIKSDEYAIGKNLSFKKIVFIPDRNQARYEIHTDHLFRWERGIKYSNLIDVLDKKFDGIIVYYNVSDNKHLLIEFIEDHDKKIQYVRTTKEGNKWDRRTVSYINDGNLVKELQKILSESDQNEEESDEIKTQTTPKHQVTQSNHVNATIPTGGTNGTETSLVFNNSTRNETTTAKTTPNNHKTTEYTTTEVPVLFDVDDDSDEDNEPNWEIIFGTTFAALAVGGAGYIIYKRRHVFRLLIRHFRNLFY